MANSVYGDISPRVGIYAVEQALSHAEPILLLQKLGLVRAVPKNKGELVKFRGPVPWGDTIVGGAGNSSTGSINGYTPPVLSEGIVPPGLPLRYRDVSVTLAEYGNWVNITDKIADLHEDPVLADQTMLAGENAAETMELITYNVVRAGTNVTYLGGSSRGAVNAAITLDAQRKVTRTLRANRAKMINNILGPSTSISTKPIEAGYIAVGHTDLEADIRSMTGFIPVAQYASRQPIAPEELGSIESTRYVLSPLFAPVIDAGAAVGTTGLKSTAGANIDVYPVIFFGKEAFGTTPLKGSSGMDIKVLNPGTPRGADPLGQNGSVGWKAWFAAVRLDETWMVRVECGVRAL